MCHLLELIQSMEHYWERFRSKCHLSLTQLLRKRIMHLCGRDIVIKVFLYLTFLTDIVNEYAFGSSTYIVDSYYVWYD